MLPTKTAKPAVRKRTRKRKRRAALSSSSSSSSPSTSSSEDDEPSPRIVKAVTRAVARASTSGSDSDSSDSSSSPSLDTSLRPHSPMNVNPTEPVSSQPTRQLQSGRSPSPPSTALPSFIPQNPGSDKEKELKEKFRKFWMSAVADGFREDLEELRKEPNLSTGRLAVLIDSLASGADVFSSDAGDGTSEMELVLGE